MKLNIKTFTEEHCEKALAGQQFSCEMSQRCTHRIEQNNGEFYWENMEILIFSSGKMEKWRAQLKF